MEFNKEYKGDISNFFNVSEERSKELEESGLEIAQKAMRNGGNMNDILFPIIDLAKNDNEKAYLSMAVGCILTQLGVFHE